MCVQNESNNFMYACDRALLYPPYDFDNDSDSLRSTSSYLFSWYLRDDKNSVLRIFMLSGSIQFSLPCQFNTNHAIVLNNAI